MIYGFVIDSSGAATDWGPGCSSATLDSCLRAGGVTEVGLEVDPENTPAVRLYQAFGFETMTTYRYMRLPSAQPDRSRSPRALATRVQASEGRSRWGSDPIGILSGKPAAGQLETHALLALAHRPAMVGAEHGPHQPCEAAEQRLFGADPPVVVGVDVVAVLHEGPHATTDEIPVGAQRRSHRVRHCA